MTRFLAFMRRWLASARLPWGLALLTLALGLPSITTGFQADDLLHRVILLGRHDGLGFAPDRPFDLFIFGHGDAAKNARILDSGTAPWWSLPNIQLAFARPVTVLTHVIDYRLWPNSAAMMHLHNLLWYAGAVLLAAMIYRRLGGGAEPVWAAGLAAFFYAVDEAHALPASWIANRNALVAAFFGFGAILFYDRWRREGSRAAGVAAPIALALAIGGGEAAVAAGGYLAAYALFLDRGTLRQRLGALIPCTLVGIVWAILYRANGYGAYGSPAYVDPGHQPLRYLHEFITRGPALLSGQWGGPPPELTVVLAEWAVKFLTIGNTLFLLAIAVILWPLRRDPVSRFYAAGMLFAVVPVAATFASGRLFMYIGLGAFGLAGRFIGAVSAGEVGFAGGWRRVPAKWLVVFLIAVHGFIAVPAYLIATQNMRAFGGLLGRASRTFPDRADIGEKTIIAANMPTCMMMAYLPIMRSLENRSFARRYRAFGSSLQPMTLKRLDERTLLVTPERGFFPPAGAPDPAHPERRAPAFDVAYIGGLMDRLVRDERTHPFKAGDVVELTGTRIEVTRVNEEGRPMEAKFTFERPLEDASYVWVQWRAEGFAPLAPPGVGESVTLAAVKLGL